MDFLDKRGGNIMTIREQLEAREHDILSPWATFADESAGREQEMQPCPYRTCFQRDRDRILHSKAFRRLSNKTQVFISPEGDHYRARLTHTLEVAQIARTIARALGLNEDLTEAIALGHDLGHTPFGHAGESALDEVCPQGFRHNEQSLRLVDLLEGLNLTREVRGGIVCHTGSRKAATPEGRIIHFADRIAYINHDIDDAIRAGILSESDIPREIADVLGSSHSARINTLVENTIANTQNTGVLSMQPEVAAAMDSLRSFMFDRVYTNPVAKGEESKAKDIMRKLFDYYYTHPDKLPEDFIPQLDFDGISRTICDYIAGMTDKYAIYKYSEIFIPTAWQVR